ncbi:MAG: hypothetical protein ABSG65_27785 [Bryobacteraceae bacterium]
MAEPTVYDFTSDQLEMRRIYELRTAALVGREFHTERLERIRMLLYWLEAISTVTASGAFVALAFWKTQIGSASLEWLVFVVAVATIARSSFRLSDLADQHARLAYSWKEIFMDLDHAAITARRVGRLTEKMRAELDFLTLRFQRVEAMDDIRGNPKKLAALQVKAENQLQPEKQWLPAS